MADQNAVLVFENTEFDVVDIHQVPWLRGPQIADALAMRDRRGIHDLYSRNADEFTDEMTQVLDLPTAGGVQPVRIFSPRGCYLLGMLARTEKAKAFRVWVLDVLEGRVAPVQQRPFVGAQIIAAHKHITGLMKELKAETTPAIRETLYAQLVQACRMASIPCPALEAIGRAETPRAVPALVETFWEAVELIGLEKLNHARAPGLLAINLMHFHQEAEAARLKLPPLNEFRHALRLSDAPRFVEANRVVSSALLGRAVRCWVFEGGGE